LLILTVRGKEKEVAIVSIDDVNNKNIIEKIAKRKGRARIFGVSEVLTAKASKETRQALETAGVGEIVIIPSRDMAERFRGVTQTERSLSELRSHEMQKIKEEDK
jgi:hypothetical protein